MKRWVLAALVLSWLVTLVAAFGAGAILGMREEAKAAHTIREMLAGLNSLANYRSYAQLASDLKGGKLGAARCKVEVTGSAFLSRLQECLDDAMCKRMVEDQVKIDAPELLVEPRVLAFRFYQPGEQCTP